MRAQSCGDRVSVHIPLDCMRTGRQSLCSPEVDVYRSSRGSQIIKGAGDPLG